MKKANLIIGTDFSKNSSVAIRVGMEWAKKLDCHPVVLHAHKSSSESKDLQNINP